MHRMHSMSDCDEGYGGKIIKQDMRLKSGEKHVIKTGS